MKVKFIVLTTLLLLSALLNVFFVIIYFYRIQPKINSVNNDKKPIAEISNSEKIREDAFQKSILCQSEGDKYVSNEKMTQNDNEFILTHRSTYSPVYNACVLLYRSQLKYANETTTFNQILNLNTRKDIYYYTYTRLNQKPFTKKIDLGDEKEYQKYLQDIFGTLDE